jgi:hypothetical protein
MIRALCRHPPVLAERRFGRAAGDGSSGTRAFCRGAIITFVTRRKLTIRLIFLQNSLQQSECEFCETRLPRLIVKIIPYSWGIKLFCGEILRADHYLNKPGAL